MSFLRRTRRGGVIELLEPANGSVTGPLQRYYWPTDEEYERLNLGNNDVGEGRPSSWEVPNIKVADLSQPKPLVFLWQAPEGRVRGIRYELLISRDPALSDPTVVPNLREPFATVRHLLIDTMYFWRVRARTFFGARFESPTWSFRTHAGTPRWIRVPNITNVRDLGGWPLGDGLRVRQGCVFRSSVMDRQGMNLTPEGRNVLLDELGIRTVLDLRSPEENPSCALDGKRVNWVNIPLAPYDFILNPENQRALREILGFFADASRYPILFHCWAGADRAGTLAFLLLALLGVESDDLIRDYELTTLSMWGRRTRHSPQFKAFLAALRNFGAGSADDVNTQVRAFVRSIGLTEEEIAKICENLKATRSRYDAV